MRIFIAYSGIWCFARTVSRRRRRREAQAECVFREPASHVRRERDRVVRWGSESRGTVSPGSIFRFSGDQDGWLYLPAKRAWVQQQRVVAIEQANAYFTNLINAKPTAEAHHHRGIARHALGYHELAIEDFDEAIRLGLTSPSLFINRAGTLLKLNEDRRAMEQIDQAIQIAPENPLAYNTRCQIWASMGNLRRALADATRAIRIDPNYAEAFNNRGVTKVKQQNFASALKDYSEAIHLFPEYVEAIANRGYAHKQLGDYRAALDDYRQAVTLAPRQPQAFNDAAWLIATCPEKSFRDGQRAVEYARHACELTEFRNGDYIDTLAAAFAEAGQFSEAVEGSAAGVDVTPRKRPSVGPPAAATLSKRPAIP